MIRVNDKWDLASRPGMTINDVLNACQFTYQHVVVSVNGALVPASQFASHLVEDGDQVSVIHIIAGG
jgi:thiamine biosynthesis protein ThiS